MERKMNSLELRDQLLNHLPKEEFELDKIIDEGMIRLYRNYYSPSDSASEVEYRYESIPPEPEECFFCGKSNNNKE
jgi:hypothetical protein